MQNTCTFVIYLVLARQLYVNLDFTGSGFFIHIFYIIYYHANYLNGNERISVKSDYRLHYA